MKYIISRSYIFPNGSVWFMNNLLSPCDMWNCRSYVNANVSVSLIFNNGDFYLKYYFFRYRNSTSKSFSLISKAIPLFSIFIHQNTKSIAGNNIHSVLEECLKAILKMFLNDVNRLTLPKRLQDVIFCAYFSKCKFYIVVFSILTIGRHINM